MPGEDSSGPAEKAVYTGYDALIQAAFKDLVACYHNVKAMTMKAKETRNAYEARRSAAYEACRKGFAEKCSDAKDALHDALDVIEKDEGRIP